jgi:gamma-carbonic anhydrase
VIEAFQGKAPVQGKDVYIAPSAQVIGDVTFDDGASVWHGAIVRGDVWRIRIGAYTNIQDGCVCHVTTGGPELNIGSRVTVGHRAVLHSCSIADGCLIGMGAILLDGVQVGSGSIVAAGCVLLPGTVIPPRSLVAGVPGKVKRALEENEARKISLKAEEYHKLALSYLGRSSFSTSEGSL